MSRPLPSNLKALYRMMSPEAAADMYGSASFVVDGVEFVCGYSPDSTPGRFYIVKSPELVEMHREFLDEHRPRRVLELGIAEGGSVALLSLMDHVEKVVAIDNEPHRLPALDEFIRARGLSQRVSAHYGVDQADREALTAIVERELDDGLVDLVIDDASHVYGLSVASFEILFPRVAPGGWYLIEDWAQHIKVLAIAAAQGLGPSTDPEEGAGGHVEPSISDWVPLSRLGLELTVGACVRSTVVDRVVVNHEFIAVRRGPEPIDPSTFRLHDVTLGLGDTLAHP